MELVWSTEKRMVCELVPYEKNPRFLTEKQRQDLTASMQKFNLVEIPAINLDNTLIAGHQRCKILMALGRGEELIDVRVPSRMLSAEELQEYNIRSNANTGSWDLSLLENEFEIGDLAGWGLDFEKAVKQNKLFEVDIPLEMHPEEDPVPDVSSKTPIVSPGDLFQLGSHRVLCADSSVEGNIQVLLAADGAPVVGDLVFTDPPYNVKIDSIVNLGAVQHKEFGMGSGEMSPAEFTGFLRTVLTSFLQNTKPGSIFFVCMDWKHMTELLSAAEGNSLEMKNLVVWVKDNGGMGSFYRSRHELIFVFKNGDAPHINNFELGQYGRYRTNVWEYTGSNSIGNPDREHARLHPTVKPLKLVADAILDCSRINGIVLDYFLGSGTTLIAAEQTQRRAYGLELDPSYVELIIRRYHNYMTRQSQPVVFRHMNGRIELNDIIRNG
ncbi:DNA modification methylase [Chitinophaga rhizosphaerae]|uniref:DNA modification methylase n=1 Tax=Chitinophaga rhizosphaerae TaxID=1864947 RepID=UPI000F802BCF|nr:DNA modification methylase [Chitinophaga rhizosphaerae]